MAIQFASYNDDNMESGKFYLIEVNKDLSSNIRPISTITTPLNQAVQDITEINAINDLQNIKINNLENYFDDYKEKILDNQARINNLEKTEIEKIAEFIDRVGITKPFVNATYIEIEHNRRTIVNVMVMENIVSSATHKEQSCISVSWRNVEDLVNGVWVKKVVIESNRPLTGYAVLL